MEWMNLLWEERKFDHDHHSQDMTSSEFGDDGLFYMDSLRFFFSSFAVGSEGMSINSNPYFTCFYVPHSDIMKYAPSFLVQQKHPKITGLVYDLMQSLKLSVPLASKMPYYYEIPPL